MYCIICGKEFNEDFQDDLICLDCVEDIFFKEEE